MVLVVVVVVAMMMNRKATHGEAKRENTYQRDQCEKQTCTMVACLTRSEVKLVSAMAS